jgi:beta-phosphoglucomutase-like phosphatase (HAD superfamily)
MIIAAAEVLGIRPEDCVLIGDIGSDLAAARAAGARSVLVPTPQTHDAERRGARVAASLADAVRFAAGRP